jgi:hypothetical protein
MRDDDSDAVVIITAAEVFSVVVFIQIESAAFNTITEESTANKGDDNDMVDEAETDIEYELQDAFKDSINTRGEET